MKYIESFREGDRIREVFLVKSRSTAVSKNGKPYDNVVLQDKTGTLDAKIWDLSNSGIEEFEKFDYVEISGEITSFQGNLQCKIERARKVGEGEYDPADYIPVSSRDINEMFAELMALVDTIKEPHLHQLLHNIFDNETLAKKFKRHSAAKSVHHGYSGGLLEHSLSVANNCDYFAKQYPFLNRDLLVTAAILHDIGKINELSEFPENDYTDEGQLLGHIIIGAEWVGSAAKKIDGFPPVLLLELRHCILAHHGELEYGSPKKPALAEALCLSFADNIDAKMETFKEALAGVPDGSLEWQGYNRLLETNIRRTSDN